MFTRWKIKYLLTYLLLVKHDFQKDDINTCVEHYDSIFRSVLDTHAPEQTKSIKIRSQPQGLSTDIINEKHKRRQL